MDTIQELLMHFNATAERNDLPDGSRRMLIKHFKAIPENPILADDDDHLGVVYHPNGTVDNAYLVYKRNGVLLKAPFKKRPIRHEYTDREYWSKNQTWFANSTVHQTQHSLWVRMFKNKKLKVLSVGF